MTIDEAIAHAREVALVEKCEQCAKEHEQLAEWLECLNEIAHIFLERRSFGEYPSSADDMWKETIRVLDKYRIELKEQT